MKYSFIIPALNEEALIGKTIKSIKRQEGSFEIIVVDNGSKDKTAKVAKDLGCRVVKEKEKGISPARNRGAKEARGEYLCFIDADGELGRNWLKSADKKLKRKKIDAIIGLNIFKHEKIYKRILYNFWTFFIYLIFSFPLVFLGKVFLPGNNFAIKKSMFAKTGGFEPVVGEDLWLSKKFWTLRGKAIFSPKMIIHYSSRGFDKSGFIKTTFYWITAAIARRSSSNYSYKNKN